jgi:hypothetical protein
MVQKTKIRKAISDHASQWLPPLQHSASAHRRSRWVGGTMTPEICSRRITTKTAGTSDARHSNRPSHGSLQGLAADCIYTYPARTVRRPPVQAACLTKFCKMIGSGAERIPVTNNAANGNCSGFTKKGYGRDSQTQLIYCVTQCFAGWTHITTQSPKIVKGKRHEMFQSRL